MVRSSDLFLSYFIFIRVSVAHLPTLKEDLATVTFQLPPGKRKTYDVPTKVRSSFGTFDITRVTVLTI